MANPIDLNAFLAAGGTQTVIDEMTVILTNRKAAQSTFPVLWTIEVGTHATVEVLVADIEEKGVMFGSWARSLLPQVTISPERRTLWLVAPSVADLGFTEATSLREVHAQAIKTYGLELCPGEAALQLRRQYTTQLKREWLWMAMEAIEDPDRIPSMFCVGRNEGVLWVYADSARPDCLCHLDECLAFVLPQAA